jgi:hypothetical protein
MNSLQDREAGRGLEQLLGWLLHRGTWSASAVIALGLAVSFAGGSPSVVRAGGVLLELGIALFILLPVLRLVLMTMAFLRQHDYRFGLISALVLAILGLGLVLALRIPA